MKTKICQAIEYTIEKHGDAIRKGSKIPYFTHPIAVMNILLEEQAFDSTITDDVIVAGLLHDLNEDAGISIETIKELYGDTVAKIVLDVSEPEELKQSSDKRGTWKQRKEHSIEVMKTADRFSKLVFCADKLANSKSINNNLLLGEDIFAQFNTGKDEIFWYYNSVLEVLGEDQSLKNTRMYKLLNLTVQKISKLSSEVSEK